MISGKYLFESGEVLYSKLRPYLRKAVVARSRGVCSADMYPLRLDPNVLDADFTAWLLVSDGFTEYANGESERSRMPKLNREQLFAWESPTPPMDEQKAIVRTLDGQIGEAIEIATTVETRLATLDRLPSALLREVFGGALDS